MATQQSLFPEIDQPEKSLKGTGKKSGGFIELPVHGMSCGKCVAKVTGALQAVDGVENAEVSLDEKLAKVRYDMERTGPERLAEAVVAAGFRLAPEDMAPSPESEERPVELRNNFV